MKAFLLFLLIFSMQGCSQFQQDKPNVNIEHKQRSEQMRRLMHSIDNEMYQKNRSEIERDDERRRYLLSLSEKLQSMSQEIQDIYSDESDENQKILDTYTQKLFIKGAEISFLTRHYQFDNVDLVLKETVEVCKACHNDLGVASSVLRHY
jgi:hypothetical protein